MRDYDEELAAIADGHGEHGLAVPAPLWERILHAAKAAGADPEAWALDALTRAAGSGYARLGLDPGEYGAMTLSVAAALMGVTAATLRAYIRNGKLHAVKVGGRWRITTRAIREFLGQ